MVSKKRFETYLGQKCFETYLGYGVQVLYGAWKGARARERERQRVRETEWRRYKRVCVCWAFGLFRGKHCSLKHVSLSLCHTVSHPQTEKGPQQGNCVCNIGDLCWRAKDESRPALLRTWDQSMHQFAHRMCCAKIGWLWDWLTLSSQSVQSGVLWFNLTYSSHFFCWIAAELDVKVKNIWPRCMCSISRCLLLPVF